VTPKTWEGTGGESTILQMRRVKFKALSDPELLGTASLESPPGLLSGQGRTDGFCACGGRPRLRWGHGPYPYLDLRLMGA
jgi:hypothetical protein